MSNNKDIILLNIQIKINAVISSSLDLFKFITPPKTNLRYLTKEKCIVLRAILPLLIILHHCSDFMDIPYLDADFGIVGGAVVGIFFFFSGYGMELKRERKSLRLIDLPSRISKLLYQLIIPTILFYIATYVRGKNIYETFAKIISSNFCTLPYSWFITTLCALYFLFHLSALLTKKYFFYCLFGTTILLHVICVIFDFPIYIYISNFAFLSGVIYKYHEPHITNIRMPFLKLSCIICIGFLTVFAMKFSDTTRPLYRFLWTFSFMALYSTAPLIKVNRFGQYLNNIGLQLYLCQGIAFTLIPSELFSGSLRTIFILGLTFVIASIVNWLYTQISSIKLNGNSISHSTSL